MTHAGRIFVEHAEQIIAQVKNLKWELTEKMAGLDAEFLKIAGSYGPSLSFIPQAIATFKQLHPVVQLSLQTASSYVIEQLLLNSAIEIGFISESRHLPNIHYELFHKDSVIAIVSPDNPLAGKDALTKEELAGIPFIVKISEMRQSVGELRLRRIFNDQHKPNIIMRCGSPGAIRAAVQEGLGVGIVYRANVESELKNGQLKALKFLDLGEKVDIYLLYHKERPLSAAANNFITFLDNSRRKIPEGRVA